MRQKLGHEGQDLGKPDLRSCDDRLCSLMAKRRRRDDRNGSAGGRLDIVSPEKISFFQERKGRVTTGVRAAMFDGRRGVRFRA